jgi:hypothetical protein
VGPKPLEYEASGAGSSIRIVALGSGVIRLHRLFTSFCAWSTPTPLTASGAHIYVSNSGGSGMKAGDSGGAWLHTKRNSTTNETHFVLSGVIHGGEGKGTHKRGVAGQPSHVRAWIDQTTGGTARWVSVLEDHM